MSDMSEIRVHERRRIVFPARLHVHNHIENVVGLDLSEGGCRIRCKRPVNIFSKVLLEIYIPSSSKKGEYTVCDPIGSVVVRWAKPSKQHGYFILGLQFSTRPGENHGINHLLQGDQSNTVDKLVCQNSSLLGHYVECFVCGQEKVHQYSLRSKAVHIKNNIFGIPTFGEPVDGKDPIDYNLLYLTICPNCNFTAPGDEFFKFSQEDEPSFDVSKFSEKWNTEKAELSAKYNQNKEGIGGESRNSEQADLSYELAGLAFKILREINPENGVFVRLDAMIKARHAQLCMTNLGRNAEFTREKCEILLKDAKQLLDDNFQTLNEIQGLMGAQLLVAISVYFGDIETLGKYMKFIDNFDASNKPEEGSQTAKILTQVRAKVKETYQNRDIYHKEKLNTFLPE